MRLPKIVYHGTPLLRWISIYNDGKMKCDLPQRFTGDTGDKVLCLSKGYIYFTNSWKEATAYAITSTFIDMRNQDKNINEQEEQRDLKRYLEQQQLALNETANISYRDFIILGLKTSNIRDNIEIDPEINLVDLSTHTEGAQWYRHKGDVKLKYLFPYKIYPFKNLTTEQMDKLTKLYEIALS